MPPPSRGNPKAGKRTSQKQQRELDAKLHQALRSLMYASYAGEDLTRHSTFVEAQRIVSGNDGRSVKQEVEDECDLDLDPREELRSVQAPVRCPEPIEPEPQVMPTYETYSEPFTEDVFFNGTSEQKVEVDEDVGQVPESNDELFDDNQPKREAKVQALAPTVDVDAVPAALDYGEETETVDIDVNKEVTLDELRTMSLEDVCLKMAHCAHASLNDSVSAGRSSSWYRNMVKNCQEAIDSHDFPRPSLPVDVERKLDQLCDVEDENFRAEKERNSRKFFRRNARLMSDGGDAFECVYPVAKTDVLDQPLLLAGISGNAKLFFKLVLEKTHVIDEESCHQDCVCYSSGYGRSNVLHFAAAHGNAMFITKVLSPGNEVEQWDKSTKAHYERMIERWVQGTTTTAGSKMCPFDMAVYYDDVSSAKALLNSQKCVNFVRFRKGDLSTPNSSLPLATYIESPLSMAVYHGNVEMLNLLEKYELIQPRHYPQAFREAANAGDLDMLHRLWLMCGERQECIVETCTTAGRKMCTPLHIACAAGHLSCVQFLCLNQELRKTVDSVGDLPIVYAIENGHTAITKYFIESFPAEIPHAIIKSAINCRNNQLAKLFLHDMLNLAERIVEIKPMKFAVEVGNFHMAEYILRLYVGYKKVCEAPWLEDVQEALRAVLCCSTLAPKEKAKFVVAFQLAGVKVSIVNVVKMVTDKALAALICNSLRHPTNQPGR